MTETARALREGAQACGAQRPFVRPFGWTCDGTRLIKVMDGSGGVPVVVRADLVDEYRADDALLWPDGAGEPIPDHADHVHAAIRRRLDEYQIAVSFGAWLTLRGVLDTSDPVLRWARTWAEERKGRRP
jgi:hypothetical protein